ncbi:hypothetical protein D3C76_1612000 [compost metagenome]
MVNRRFHDSLQALLQMFLGDVMLILSHTNRLRIDLHQLCQRVLHTAGDRSRAALRYIQIREFLLRQLGS